MTAEVPVQFTHSVKIEETAQGIRLHIHVYATDRATAIHEAFETYRDSIAEADSCEYLRAPMEVKKK
jgi:hypothetical protein